MKILIILMSFLPFISFAGDCVVDLSPGGANPKDCIHCTEQMKTPGDKVHSTFASVNDFITNKDDQKKMIDTFKGYERFLNSQKNKNTCSNYDSILKKFQKDFKKELAECEKGPAMFDRNKMLCEWVLNNYSNKVIDTFYAHWTKIGANGQPTLIPGKTKEQIEGPIRAHESWCRKVKSNYKNKMFINCGDVTDWVREFDIVRKVSESMRRDRENQEAAKATSSDRNKLFEEGCKYFETNPATTFTSQLYLECITR